MMLKFQYFGHLMQRTDSLEKTLMLGKVEDRRRRGWQKMRWLDGITDSWWTWVWASFGSWWRTGKPGVLQSMGLQKVGHNWATGLNRLTTDIFSSPLDISLFRNVGAVFLTCRFHPLLHVVPNTKVVITFHSFLHSVDHLRNSTGCPGQCATLWGKI